ncbi:hypothetical protein PVAP13_9NG425428 [Panicum virgatum]|uniref:Uncharacterized protein n=1 Tax=Panicum virgatum TaxID=38727 RepID=A0A8T0MSX2_PANVG|nr:hypothetical protein PVAP13_9NG425428 [Panicum virgatum]
MPPERLAPRSDRSDRSRATGGPALAATGQAAGGTAQAGAGLAAQVGGVVAAAEGLAEPADGVPLPAVEGPTDVVALARTMMPNVPLPAIEHNLPFLEVQRSHVHARENMEPIDWEKLQIVETHDDEGRIELMSESKMCELLGIRDESAPNIGIPTNDEQRHDNAFGKNVDGAAIPTNDEVPKIEPMIDKTQWPQVELPLSVGARGHKKKGKGKEDGKEANVGEGENDTAPTDAKGKKMVRGPMTCRRCGEKGHRQASAKCPLNGTAKKRKRRQPRKNVTKMHPEPSTPRRPTREEILQDSPGRVTRISRCGVGTSSQTDTTTPVRMPTAAAPRKMTPKRKLHI